MSDAIRLAFDALPALGKVPAWLAPLRRAGMDRFAEVGFPGTRDEEWRFTPIAPIARSLFAPATPPARPVGRDDLGTSNITGTIVHFWPDTTIFQETVYKKDILEGSLRELAYLNKPSALPSPTYVRKTKRAMSISVIFIAKVASLSLLPCSIRTATARPSLRILCM